MDLLQNIAIAKEYIKGYYDGKFDAAVILGTGLGSLSKEVQNKITLKYKDIHGFPVSTVLGHAGELIIGDLSGKKVLLMNGRFHYYEGNTMEKVTFAVRVMKSLGIEKIVVSNAAGGMNPEFKAGDLMIITDHVNLMGTNPLIGKNYEELGPRFPDMSSAYNKELIQKALSVAEKQGLKLQKGVYAAVSGPTFETPAELRMLRLMGGDAVGMSTVPEVIVANHMGMKVLGISCITDMALADSLAPLDHKQVLETANRAMKSFVSLVKDTISII